MSALIVILGHFKSEFRKKKVSGIFPITRSGRMQKRKKKKKKKKNSYGTISLAIFLFPMIKRAEKKVVLFFSVRGEGKCAKKL